MTSSKKCWIYIKKDDWCNMQEEFIRKKESTGSLVKVEKLNKLNELKWWNPSIGIYQFIPCNNSLRALLITRYIL